jgi:hypothetical protein
MRRRLQWLADTLLGGLEWVAAAAIALLDLMTED